MKEQTGADRLNSRLNGRDLINVGVYTAIYFVITIALSMTGLTWMPVIFSMITGLLAELVYRRGRYESVRSAVLTFGRAIAAL